MSSLGVEDKVVGSILGEVTIFHTIEVSSRWIERDGLGIVLIVRSSVECWLCDKCGFVG